MPPKLPRRLGALTCTLALAAAGLAAGPAPAQAADEWRVGRGVADITGEPGEVGMMGYGSSSQKTSGIHMRQYARSFVVESGGRRVLLVHTDALTGTDAVRQEVLGRLKARYGTRWTEANVMISGSHTHATPGGTTDYALYNVTTMGFHSDTFRAQVDGIVASVERAEADLAPATVQMSRSELTGAAVQRSRPAFDRNPQWVKDRLPNGSDPASVTMSFTRGGRTDGVINWYATHPTSLTAQNTLISSDNKGYAEYLWEHETAGVDHTSKDAPAMVAAFAMSNGADQSPNLNLRPGSGPTEDEFLNMYELGRRQFDAAYGQMSGPKTAQTGGVDSRIVYVDMENATAPAEFTGTGRDEKTCGAVLGASFGAGSVEDGPGPAFLNEGAENNPFFLALTKTQYDIDPALRACQSPKATLFDVGRLKSVQTKLPVQVVRIGQTWIVGMPGEVTAGSGVRLRQTVADAVGTAPENVVVQAVANAYGHYFTTPEEYASQQYEGGATLFGRNTLPALQGTVKDLASAIRDGRDVPLGAKPTRPSHVESTAGKVVYDVPGVRRFGDVLSQPGDIARGQIAQATFQGAHPNNDLRHGDTYLEVQRRDGDRWVKVADDNDEETKFIWRRHLAAQSHVTIEWQAPANTPAGEHRIVYKGAAKDGLGRINQFTGTSATFRVR